MDLVIHEYLFKGARLLISLRVRALRLLVAAEKSPEKQSPDKPEHHGIKMNSESRWSCNCFGTSMRFQGHKKLQVMGMRGFKEKRTCPHLYMMRLYHKICSRTRQHCCSRICSCLQIYSSVSQDIDKHKRGAQALCRTYSPRSKNTASSFGGSSAFSISSVRGKTRKTCAIDVSFLILTS